jgi:hypothetical protein
MEVEENKTRNICYSCEGKRTRRKREKVRDEENISNNCSNYHTIDCWKMGKSGQNMQSLWRHWCD